MAHDLTVTPAAARTTGSPIRLWWRRFFIRLRAWEYWPVYVFNLPVLGFWAWYALRARDAFFFALTNPGIETGGFFGESKSAILGHVPVPCKPLTRLLRMPVSPEEAVAAFRTSGLAFPVIAKPEVGERGWHIERLDSEADLSDYVTRHPIDTILQTYVDLPLEVSIMVYRMPDGSGQGVTSVCEKHFLQVRGDGTSPLGALVMAQDRAVLQLNTLMSRFGDRWDEILPEGEVLILEHVGNHCRGTLFLDRNDQIDPALEHVMLDLLGSLPDVYYGRFDMRVASWESLKAGTGIQVLEFNGTSADPAHIYQPGYSLLKAYTEIRRHWGIMYRIARQNAVRGYRRPPSHALLSALILYFRYKRDN